jgi:hypothetical protein
MPPLNFPLTFTIKKQRRVFIVKIKGNKIKTGPTLLDLKQVYTNSYQQPQNTRDLEAAFDSNPPHILPMPLSIKKSSNTKSAIDSTSQTHPKSHAHEHIMIKPALSASLPKSSKSTTKNVSSNRTSDPITVIKSASSGTDTSSDAIGSDAFDDEGRYHGERIEEYLGYSG